MTRGVVVDSGNVVSVAYVPTTFNPLFGEYRSRKREVDQLHEVVATAARFGTSDGLPPVKWLNLIQT